jgi:hypothetical protein
MVLRIGHGCLVGRALRQTAEIARQPRHVSGRESELSAKWWQCESDLAFSKDGKTLAVPKFDSRIAAPDITEQSDIFAVVL